MTGLTCRSDLCCDGHMPLVEGLHPGTSATVLQQCIVVCVGFGLRPLDVIISGGCRLFRSPAPIVLMLCISMWSWHHAL